jgi:hypothetical protein
MELVTGKVAVVAPEIKSESANQRYVNVATGDQVPGAAVKVWSLTAEPVIVGFGEVVNVP